MHTYSCCNQYLDPFNSSRLKFQHGWLERKIMDRYTGYLPCGEFIKLHNRPISNRTITMIKTSPMPPLGPYPQPLLWGQLGTAPININTRIINNTVPNDIFFSLLCQLLNVKQQYFHFRRKE